MTCHNRPYTLHRHLKAPHLRTEHLSLLSARFRNKWYAAEIQMINQDGTYKCRFLRYNYVLNRLKYPGDMRLVEWPLMPFIVHGLKSYLQHVRKKLRDKKASEETK